MTPHSTVMRALVLMLAALVSACGGGGGGSDSGTSARTLQSIAVSPSTAAIAGGATQQFTALGSYSDGSTADLTGSVTWSSSNTAVATVSAQGGLAQGLADGTTTIRATSASVSGTAQLQVSRVPVSLSVTPSGPATLAGSTLQFSAIAQYDVGNPADVTSAVTWSSRTPGVASITAGGLATALAPGASTISASLGQLVGSSLLQVNLPTGWRIDVVRPTSNGALVGTPLEVAINATGPGTEVQSVVATVADRSLPLVYQASSLCSGSLAPPLPPECWRGALNLAGLPRNYYSLVIRATDVLGNSMSWTQEILVDFGPSIQVTQPASPTVARPTLTVAASCTDDDARGCASITAQVCRDISPSDNCSQPMLSGTTLPERCRRSCGLRRSGEVPYLSSDRYFRSEGPGQCSNFHREQQPAHQRRGSSWHRTRHRRRSRFVCRQRTWLRLHSRSQLQDRYGYPPQHDRNSAEWFADANRSSPRIEANTVSSIRPPNDHSKVLREWGAC